MKTAKPGGCDSTEVLQK